MNRRQQTEAEAFLRSNEYAATRVPDFTHQPATKAWQQGAALGDRVGATAAIRATLRAGKSAVKTLNAIFRQIYKGNHQVLAAWRSASHEQRAARPAAPVATPPAQAVPT